MRLQILGWSHQWHAFIRLLKSTSVHAGRAEEFQQGTDDLSDDDFDPDGEIDDSAPGYRRRMQNVSNLLLR